MKQLLLFPDPRPLVERLGAGFFRQLPETPGVYLMKGAADAPLYVGKAKNLRVRLRSYRVANPDRMPRRHLRLLRAVERIDIEELPDERAALEREAHLLRTLRPRFNRAGTWFPPEGWGKPKPVRAGEWLWLEDPMLDAWNRTTVLMPPEFALALQASMVMESSALNGCAMVGMATEGPAPQ
jgi:predicted GIY-YIG superfamily endonuclease